MTDWFSLFHNKCVVKCLSNMENKGDEKHDFYHPLNQEEMVE
jgi:hypothetical protein